MSDHELVELAQDVDVRCRLHGDFVLRSGAVAHEYFDKYLFEADPILLRRIVARMVALVPPGTDMVGGLELGGVPMATILSNLTVIPTVLAEATSPITGDVASDQGARPIGGPRIKGPNQAALTSSPTIHLPQHATAYH